MTRRIIKVLKPGAPLHVLTHTDPRAIRIPRDIVHSRHPITYLEVQALIHDVSSKQAYFEVGY